MPSQNWFYLFECDPTLSFLAAVRRVFADFEPCDAHWDKLGKTIEFKTGKPLEEVRWMFPEHVEIFLDLFFPAAAEVVAQPKVRQSQPPGRPEKVDSAEERDLVHAWQRYLDDEDRDGTASKQRFAESLPQVVAKKTPAARQGEIVRVLRIIRNKQVRDRRKGIGRRRNEHTK